MNSPKIGIGLPTRGIIDTLTIESVLREAVNTEVDYELFSLTTSLSLTLVLTLQSVSWLQTAIISGG